MARYRPPELDLLTRMTLGLEMLTPIPQRSWGRVTELAKSYGVSRTFLYNLREWALDALVVALAPRDLKLHPQTDTLAVDEVFLRRAITVLPMLKGTVRYILKRLALLFGIHRSVGCISQTLQEAGAAAAAYNASLSIPLPVLGEADKIFLRTLIG